jgi:hypothetical protein
MKTDITLEEACSQESRFYNALNGQERIVYMTGAKFGANWKSNRLSKKEREMREVLAKWENEAKSYKQYDDRIELGIITGCIQDLKEALKEK